MISQGSDNSENVSQWGNLLSDISLRRLLIVQWDRHQKIALGNVAGRLGFEVTICSRPSDARNLIDGTSFDSILIDSKSYDDELKNFLKWISSIGKEKPYVILAMKRENVGDFPGLIRSGVDDFLFVESEEEELITRLQIMESRICQRRTDLENFAKIKRDHNRYESLFLESPEALLVLKNRRGKVIGVNRAVKSVLGYDGKALLGKYMSLIFPQIFGKDGHATSGEVLSGSTILKAISYRRPDGKHMYLDIMMSAIPWDSGYAVMMLCRDVSWRAGEEESKIKDSKDQALARFAEGIGDEFGDLFTSLGGNLSLLESAEYLNEESQDTIKCLQQACERGREIIREIATVRGGRKPKMKNKLDLPDFIRKTVHFSLFDYDKILPVFNFEKGLFSVMGDEEQIRQMLNSLVGNAAEVMSESGTRNGRIIIDGLNVVIDEESPLPLDVGDYVHLTFKDNGPKLMNSEIDQIFDPYFSRDKSVRGFGLSRAASICRLHNGYIFANPKEDGGACFELYLPANSKNDFQASGERSNDLALRVLVLDDEPHICSMVEKALTREGHEVFCVSTGKAALRAYDKAEEFERPFDVLLFDLDVRGGMRGDETLAQIRAKNPGVKAIVTTGYVDDTVLENYLEHGFCGILTKPFRISHLTSTVERLGHQKND
ncbi:MAG: response regulator [Verrucomicrobiales bacterium]